MFDVIAGWASIAGLGLTIWAIVAATGAAKAARQARAEVRKSNAADEFKHLQYLGGELLSFLEQGQVDAALVRSRDLTTAMRNAARRWQSLITAADARRYEESALQVSVIARMLASHGAPDVPREKQKMLAICHEVLSVISAVSGSVTARIETQGETHARLRPDNPETTRQDA